MLVLTIVTVLWFCKLRYKMLVRLINLSLWYYVKVGRIKTQAAHFWNFLWGLLCTGDLAFHLQYLFAIIKVTPTTFYKISKIRHICSIFRKSVYIRVVHIFWDRASFVVPLFPRKGGQNSENLWMTFVGYFLKIVCIFFAYWRTAEKILLFNSQKV